MCSHTASRNQRSWVTARSAPDAPGRAKRAFRCAAKKEVARIERKLERLRAEASSLEAKLEKLSIQVATDPSVVSELTKVSAAHQDVLAEIDELEEAWLEAADLLE